METLEQDPVREVEGIMPRRWYKPLPGQIVWAICGAMLFVTLLLIQQFVAAVVCGLIFAAGYRRRLYSPTYYTWYEHFVSRVSRKALPETPAAEAVSDDDGSAEEVEEVVEDESAEHLSPTSRPPINLRVTGFELEPERELGTLFNTRASADTALVVGSGWQGAALGPKDRYVAENILIDAVRRTANMYDGPIGFSMMYPVRPMNIEPRRTWNDQNLHQSTLDAAPDNYLLGKYETAAEVYARNASEVDQMDRAVGRSIVPSFAVTVPRPDDWPYFKNGDIPDGVLTQDQIRNAPVSVLARELEISMAGAGVKDARALDPIDLKRYIRSSWDIAGISEWNKFLADNAKAVQEDRPPKERVTPDGDVYWPWPEHEIYRGHNFLKIGGTYHRVLRLSRFQTKRFLPGDCDELYFTNIGLACNTGLTIAFCGETVSAESEAWWLQRSIVMKQGRSRMKQEDENYLSLQQREDNDQLIRRQDKLYLGGNLAMLYNVYIVVSAVSPRELIEAEEIVRSECRNIGVRIMRVPLEARQLRAFFTATLGVNMM